MSECRIERLDLQTGLTDAASGYRYLHDRLW